MGDGDGTVGVGVGCLIQESGWLRGGSWCFEEVWFFPLLGWVWVGLWLWLGCGEAVVGRWRIGVPGRYLRLFLFVSLRTTLPYGVHQRHSGRRRQQQRDLSG